MTEQVEEVQVLVVGGGPVGLATAIELGRRSISTLLIEQVEEGAEKFPTANNVGIRTMEHLRRWGLAEEVRRVGPSEYSNRRVYLTAIGGHELFRFEMPAACESAIFPYSPESFIWCPKMYFDPVLERYAKMLPSVRLRYGTKFTGLEQDEDGVTATLESTDGATRTVRAQYVVGCDGAAGTTRRLLGIDWTGVFPDRTSTVVYFRSSALRGHLGVDATQYWIGGNGNAIISIDGNERWRTRVPGGADVQEHLSKFLGEGTDFEVISTWSMRGSRAMANSYRSGRVFLAGDSAHMHTPYGGKAANTGMQDGIDLAWKLGAVLQGWGGPHLLDSYQVERRPIALQLHRFQGLDLSGAEPRPIPGGGPEVPGLNLDFHGDSPEAKRARIETADRLREARKDEFDHPGLELGFRYEGSPIIWPDESPAPPEEITSYTQTSRPGARAPHGWLKAGVSTLDTLGDGFTLMRFGPSTLDTSSFESAAVRRGVPLTLADFDQPHLRELYGGVRMALVRPDGMVAWRGDVLPRPDELLDRVCGFEAPSAARTSKQATSAGMRA